MEIKVIFYGILSDVTGMRMKTYTGVTSFNDLKLRLSDDFPGIQNYSWRISRNLEFVNGDITLNDGDEITLANQIPGDLIAD